jgi:hypothetical protein
MATAAKKKGDLSLKGLLPIAKKSGQVFLRYAGIVFFVFIALVYGFVVFRINALSNAQPSDSDVSAQSAKATTIPHIDPKVVEQLLNLRDNSVNVQTLFEQARDNPFQE